jgi:hypothetical protein
MRTFNTEVERDAYIKGLLDAAEEVSGHWNDSQTMTNQKDQASRSSSVLISMARKYSKEV